MRKRLGALAVGCAAAIALVAAGSSASATSPSYDISTLAGKVAAVNGTQGLAIRFSAFIEQEANDDPFDPIAVDGATLGTTSSLAAPAVTVNQDTHGAPQNETSIAVDPNNPNRLVASANDYVARTWACSVGSTPCSALADGYSGTYYSNDGGATWCCNSSDPAHLGTLIPGVEHLTGGPYDAGGDPSVAFDGDGHVYYAGLGFNRTSPPNTVTVSRGTFNGSGQLTWSAPTFVNQTTSPSTLNDKEWIAVDKTSHRVYVSWTRFLFNPSNGSYVQSPIAFAYSADGGKTFSTPQLISGNILYGQGSRPVVAPDGTVYVFWDGSTRRASLDSIYVVKSTDGGATWSKPTAVSTMTDIPGLRSTAFRVNSWPAVAAAPNGTLYVTYLTYAKKTATSFAGDESCAYWLAGSNLSACTSVAVWSKSTDGGQTWSAPERVFPAASRAPVGYPVTQPDGSTLNAPASQPVEDVFQAVTVAPSGAVYFAAYRGSTVSPWQSCTTFDPNGSIKCNTPGPYVNNTKLDYVVQKLGGSATTASTAPVNTRYQFRGGFIGDYTDIASGSDGKYHALWTDTSNSQTINWWYGVDFGGILASQQDIATRSGQ